MCAPYQQEFLGNPHYQHAVNQPFGSGRSRFFGYIEAQVLHAVVRHYKPARLIEIGGGVPTYCTFQAISMNGEDTGVNGRVLCVEPGPVDLVKDIDKVTDNVELIARPIQAVPLSYFGIATQTTSSLSTPIMSSDRAVRLTSSFSKYFRSSRRVCWCISMISISPTIMTETFWGISSIQMRLRLLPRFLRVMRGTDTFSLSMLHYDRRHEMQSVLPESDRSGLGAACALASAMRRGTSRLRYGCALRGRVRYSEFRPVYRALTAREGLSKRSTGWWVGARPIQV